MKLYHDTQVKRKSLAVALKDVQIRFGDPLTCQPKVSWWMLVDTVFLARSCGFYARNLPRKWIPILA